MSCIVNGCNQPNYHYNPLISPLLDFHETIASRGCQLPKEGKVTEIAQRIGMIVLSPFIYLALAFAALAGLIFNRFWERKHISEAKDQESSTGSEILGIQKTELKKNQISQDNFGNVFGRELWEKHWGTIGEVAPLPEEAFEPSPINKDKPMIHDFEFFWMAPSVDGEPLTVPCIEKKGSADKFGEHKLGFSKKSFTKSIGTDSKINEPLKLGYWFAVPKNPNVKAIAYKYLQQQLDYIAENFSKEFGLLRTREALVYCLMQRARDGVCSLAGSMTRCEEVVGGEHVGVQACNYGFFVNCTNGYYSCFLPVRRFC